MYIRESLLEGAGVEPKEELSTVCMIIGVLRTWAGVTVENQYLALSRLKQVLVVTSAATIICSIRGTTTSGIEYHMTLVLWETLPTRLVTGCQVEAIL